MSVTDCLFPLLLLPVLAVLGLHATQSKFLHHHHHMHVTSPPRDCRDEASFIAGTNNKLISTQPFIPAGYVN